MSLATRTRIAAPERDSTDGATLWYRSPQARRFIFARFVPLLAAGNLFWEALQLPFYTLWREGTPQERVFAVLHCTAGDVIIGTTSLLFAVLLFGRRGWPSSQHGAVAAATVLFGVMYTIFSEWTNTQVTMSWQYAESMPRVPPLGSGIMPLLQWLIVPPLAYGLAWALGRANESRS